MEYDFFDDNNGQKDGERVPALVQSDVNAAKPPRKIRWWQIALAVGLSIVLFFCGYFTCWLSLDEQLRSLYTVKKTIQKEYYKEITDEDFYGTVFSAINSELLDDYSTYMTAEEAAAYFSALQGNSSGVGMVFTTGGDEELRITRVCGNSPAEGAGILAGEFVLGCGKTEESIEKCVTFDEFSECLSKYRTGEEFFVEIGSEQGARLVKLSKQAYVENYVFYRDNDGAYAFTGEKAETLTEKGTPLACLDDDTAYIRLIEFTGNADLEFDGAMKQFKKEGKKNLVLDLRGNGGGLLDVMQSIASYFCKNTKAKTPVVAVADFGKSRAQYHAKGNYYGQYFAEDSRICVLADSGSASASECLLGSMLDYGAISYGDICLAERNGVAKTFGKGIMQQTYWVNLFKGDAVKLTTAEIRWPISDNSIHGVGILPTKGTLTVAENGDFEQETTDAILKLFVAD